MTIITLIIATALSFHSPQVVAVFDDGRAVAVEKGIEPEQVPADHFWVWAEGSAPRRIAPTRLDDPLPEDSARLVIRVPAASDGLAKQGVIIAAPSKMWEELPEELLPQWSVPEDGIVKVAIDGVRPWRLRYIGISEGTWWEDVPAARRAVAVFPSSCSDIEAAVAYASGERAANAQLRIFSSRSAGLEPVVLATFRADTDGRFRLRSLPDRLQALAVITSEGSGPLVIRGRLPDLPPMLRLPEGVEVTGLCVDEHRRPIANATVQLEAWLAPSIPIPWTMQTRSDEMGRWAFAGLSTGEVLVIAQAEGRCAVRRQTALVGSRIDLGEVVLVPGLAMLVKVVDEDGAPIPAAGIKIDGVGAGSTDGEGQVLLSSLPAAGSVKIQASAEGFLPSEQILSSPIPEAATVVLNRAFTVSGRLIDPEGLPVEQGTVQAETGTGRLIVASIDSKGRFVIDLEPGVPSEVTASSPSTMPSTLHIEPGGPGEHRDLGDLEAWLGLCVTGRVVVRESGQPVSGARVWLPRPSAKGSLMAWFQGDLLETRAGADGRFVLSGAPSIPLLLRVDAPRYARSIVRVVPAGETSQVDAGEIELSTGATVRIVPERAAEGATAEVDLSGQGMDVDVLSAVVSNGDAEVRHVPPGQARILVKDGRSLVCDETVEIPNTDREIEVKCTRSRIDVRGEVLLGDRVAGEGRLIWMSSSGEGLAIVRNYMTPGGLRQQETFGGQQSTVVVEVGADGRFVTDELRPGAWQVLFLAAGGTSTEPRQVTLPKASEYDLTFSFSDAEVLGRVVESAGDSRSAVQGCRVRELVSGAAVPVDVMGEFHFKGLAPGPARLVARCGTRSSPVHELEILPESNPMSVELIVEQDEEGMLRVNAADVVGDPLAGAVVFAQAEIGRMVVGSTDGRGSVELNFGQPRPDRVRAAAFAAGSWVLGSWQSWDEASAGLHLAAAETGVMEVTSDTVSGRLAVAGPGGWDVGSLMAHISTPPVVTPQRAALLSGLPPGAYQVIAGEAGGTVTVRPGEIAHAELR